MGGAGEQRQTGGLLVEGPHFSPPASPSGQPAEDLCVCLCDRVGVCLSVPWLPVWVRVSGCPCVLFLCIYVCVCVLCVYVRLCHVYVQSVHTGCICLVSEWCPHLCVYISCVAYVPVCLSTYLSASVSMCVCVCSVCL